MNRYLARVCVALSLLTITGQAMAIPTLKQVHPTFYQDSGNGKVYAGVLVVAETNLAVLGVGGGFTIACGTSPLTLVAQRVVTVNNPLGPTVMLNVPDPNPGIYTIPNWSSIPAGTCGGIGQCVLQYKGEAHDETAQFSAGLLGTGVSFELIPDGQISLTDSTLISICRFGQPQCCTPGCDIQ